jgi:cytoskeleton protein RodZ
MNAPDSPSVGQVLRAAREAQGLTLDDVAARLRLMHRQIEAMEADAFSSLGQMVFARGFVRNYARLLGLAPETLLARMEGAPAEAAAVRQAVVSHRHSWLASPWFVLLVLGLVLLLVVPVGLYWWLNGEVDDSPSPAAAQRMARPAAESPPSTRAVPLPAATPAPVVQPLAQPQPPAASDVETRETGEAGAPAAPENATPVTFAPVAGAVLHLAFAADAWARIKDANGRLILDKRSPAGSQVDVRGMPPFELEIGNAAQARLTYNGRAIDLLPFVDATVARFTLE